MEERLAIAQSLEKTEDRLKAYPDLLLRDLPSDLQRELRSQECLAPLTSSGIEHIKVVRNRIIWAIYYLRDASFPQRYQQQASQPPATHPTHESQLDFGSFDPRKSQ